MNSAIIVWLAATFAGFLVWWPIGVALLTTLFLTALSQQLTGYASNNVVQNIRLPRFVSGSTGNTAFDQYRDNMLRQLEDDQHAFHGFMDKLRRAKDRAEFDQFMVERHGASRPQMFVPPGRPQ